MEATEPRPKSERAPDEPPPSQDAAADVEQQDEAETSTTALVPRPATRSDSGGEAASATSCPSPPKDPATLRPAFSMTVITPQQSALAQMEEFLVLQLTKCDFYKRVFEEQANVTMIAKFATIKSLTENDLELVRKLKTEGGAAAAAATESSNTLPSFRFDLVQVTNTPTNLDVQERELQLMVRSCNLPVEHNSTTYIVGEFEFPVTKEESLVESGQRWLKSVRIRPSNLICCSQDVAPKQLDQINSTPYKPFFEPESKFIEYDGALKFFIEKPRSRNFKRKFKPIKLTIYERTNLFRFDKRVGTVEVRVDLINDEASHVVRAPVMKGRKLTEAIVDVRVKVREPLVDKTIRAHNEKILSLL